MLEKHILQEWLIEALRSLNGAGTPAEVCRTIWDIREDDLRQHGDLFYTWQTDVHGAAQQLQDAGRLYRVESDRMIRWHLEGRLQRIEEKEGACQQTQDTSEAGQYEDLPAGIERSGEQLDEAISPQTEIRNLGSIFRHIQPSSELLPLVSDARMRNALQRRGYRFFRDVSYMQPRQFLALQNVGELSVKRLVTDLADANINAMFRFADEAKTSPDIQENSHNRSSDWQSNTIANLSVIAEWRALLGQPNSSVVAENSMPSMPPEVAVAFEQLHGLTASTVIGARTNLLGDALNEIVESFDERWVAVLRDRTFSDKPATLDALGSGFRVTRERIRQIESKATKEFKERIAASLLGGVALLVGERIQGVSDLETLLREIPSLRQVVPSLNQPAWRIFDRLDPAYEIMNGWCARSSLASAIDATRSVLSAYSSEYVISVPDVIEILEQVNVPNERFSDWLSECGYVTLSGHVLLRGDGIRERAVAVLELAGEPLSASDIRERLGIDRSLPAVKNALSFNSPEIFTRVDRGEVYALSEWGLPGYASIRDSIRAELESGDGKIKLSEIVDRLTSRFSVSPKSVIAYASSYPFEVRNGLVGLATDRRLTSKSPWSTRRLYRVGSCWMLRSEVTQDHARGAGSLIPSTLAAAIGLEPGTALELQSQLGPQSVSARGLQPALGSIRRFIERENLQLGDSIFLCFSDGGEFSVKPMSSSSHSIIEAALSLIGASAGQGEQPLEVLAAAVGTTLHEGLSGLVSAYRARGDDDVAELLELL